jgi:DNA helicase-2/ATP-dependent DNA helicase PcrA
MPVHRVFRKIHEGQSPVEFSDSIAAKVKEIFQDLLDFVQISGSQNAGRVIYAFLERTGYLKSLVEEKSLQAELKIKNIRIFFDKVKNFSELTDDDSIFSFAQYLSPGRDKEV